MQEEQIPGVPDDVGRKLWERRNSGSCTALRKVYYAISLSDVLVGAVGDGANASYEWFVWRDGVLELSDVGYGDPHVALRDVLIAELG